MVGFDRQCTLLKHFIGIIRFAGQNDMAHVRVEQPTLTQKSDLIFVFSGLQSTDKQFKSVYTLFFKEGGTNFSQQRQVYVLYPISCIFFYRCTLFHLHTTHISYRQVDLYIQFAVLPPYLYIIQCAGYTLYQIVQFLYRLCLTSYS